MNPEILNWGTISGLYIMAVLLIAGGYLGAVLPYPGCFVTLLGCICIVIARGEPYPEWWFWGIQLSLALFGTFVDNITTALGAKRFGGSRSSFWCAMLGLFVGAFFFPFGLIIGPFLGAFAAEVLLARKTIKSSVHAGIGATLGLLVGVVCKLIISTIMITSCFL